MEKCRQDLNLSMRSTLLSNNGRRSTKSSIPVHPIVIVILIGNDGSSECDDKVDVFQQVQNQPPTLFVDVIDLDLDKNILQGDVQYFSGTHPSLCW